MRSHAEVLPTIATAGCQDCAVLQASAALCHRREDAIGHGSAGQTAHANGGRNAPIARGWPVAICHVSRLSRACRSERARSALIAYRRSLMADRSSPIAHHRLLVGDRSSPIAHRRSLIGDRWSAIAHRRSLRPRQLRARRARPA
jgi:hypothetical protein